MKRRPKKSNPKAKKSRTNKVECELCGKIYHVSSIKAHYVVSHRLEVHHGD